MTTPDAGMPARTPRGDAYGAAAFADQCERLFPRTWHVAAFARGAPAPGHAEPVTLLPDALGEPIVWTRDDAGGLRCLSNVCTHRGKVVLDAPARGPVLRCDYHGRCFDLDGRLRAAPGFEDARGFPGPDDDLPRVPFGEWGGLRFCSLAPTQPFAAWIAPVAELMAAWHAAPPAAPTHTRDYELDANWALYVENYLEGFHVPYVHKSLARGLDLGDYLYESWEHGTLQLATAKAGEPALEFAAGHRLHGRRVAGAYVWLFPCTMLNFYAWGLSLNAVEPLGPARTRVRYATYVTRPEHVGRGAGGDLDTVEREDQQVVLATQRGVRARLYRGGRYSPGHEAGLALFHRLLRG